METHDLFDAFQSAYRPYHSCETVIVRIQDDILKSLDSHKYVILVLLDLSSAFDSVDHDMGKAHKNCIIGQKFCLHHITGTAFIIRLKLYAYIVENSETFQKIYSFMYFK